MQRTCMRAVVHAELNRTMRTKRYCAEECSLQKNENENDEKKPELRILKVGTVSKE